MRIPTRRTVGLTATMLGVVSLGVGFVAGPASADHDPNAVHLKDEHRNTSQDAEGFGDDDCGDLDPADGPIWHFVANNLADGSVAVSMSGFFGPEADNATEEVAAAVTRSNPQGTTWQFFVQSTQPVLVDAVAVFDRAEPDAQMVLSHICPGDVTPPTTTSTTSTTVQETTTTVPETTTTAAPTTTTTAAVLGTSVTQAQPQTEVLGVQETRTLPRTGADNAKTMALSLGLILFGLGVVLLGQDRRAFAAGYRS